MSNEETEGTPSRETQVQWAILHRRIKVILEKLETLTNQKINLLAIGVEETQNEVLLLNQQVEKIVQDLEVMDHELQQIREG